MEALCGQLSKKEESSWSDSGILVFSKQFSRVCEAKAWDHLNKCIFLCSPRQFSLTLKSASLPQQRIENILTICKQVAYILFHSLPLLTPL